MTTETKQAHTAGPWKVDETFRVLALHGSFLKSKEQPVFVVANNVYLTGEWAEREANARLIAACPTMYDYIAKKASEGDAEAQSIIAVL